jgi:hypothetical protein
MQPKMYRYITLRCTVVRDRDQNNFQLAAEILRKAKGGTADEMTDIRNVLAEAWTLPIDWPPCRRSCSANGANETLEPSKGAGLQTGRK